MGIKLQYKNLLRKVVKQMNKKMMFIFLVALLSFSVFAVSAIAGCSTSASTTIAETTAAETTAAAETTVAETTAAETTAAKKLVIGRIYVSEADNYQQACIKAAQNFAAENNIELLVGSSDADINKEIGIFEDFLAKKVDAIIMQPVEGADANQLIKNAQAVNIPVIIWGIKHTEGSAPFLSPNEKDANTELGKKCAELWLSENPDTAIKAGVLTMEEIAFVKDQRTDRFIDGVLSVAPDAEIIKQDVLRAPDKEAVMGTFEDLITANPDINLVFGPASFHSLAAQTVLETIGRGTKETEIVSGVSGDMEEYEKIKDPNSSYRFTTGLLPKDGEIACFEMALKVINSEVAIDSDVEQEMSAVVLGIDSDWKEYLKAQWDVSIE